MNKKKVTEDEVRESDKSQITWAIARVWFYSKCDGKQLEDFEQEESEHISFYFKRIGSWVKNEMQGEAVEGRGVRSLLQ